MDRRTLIFALAMFMTYFLVTTYFDWQHQEKVQQWNIEQQAKKQTKLSQLETQAAENTATLEELPITKFYKDADGQILLGEGIKNENAVMTISWDNNTPPLEIYVAQEEGKKPEKFSLSNPVKGANEFLLYEKSGDAPLTIGHLPDIGNATAQVITFSNPNGQPTVQLGKVQDGLFSIVDDEIENTKYELNSSYKKTAPLSKTGLVVYRQNNKYLPVGIYYGEKKHFVQLEDIISLDTTKISQVKTSQEYYVLENDYQQLVFTNIGGALTEINLPFATKENTLSVVKGIDFDKEILKDHPYNDRFPAHPYYTAGTTTTGPFVQHPEGKLGGFHPLLRRDLNETGQWKSIQLNPRYYALNLLADQPEISELVYTVKYFDAHKLVLEAQHRQRKITKTFTLPENAAPYCFEATIKIDGERRGLWLTSGVPEIELFSGSPEPSLKYRITRAGKPSVESISLPKETLTNSTSHADWLCNSNGFFGIILDPLQDVSDGFMASFVPGQTAPSRLVEIDQEYNRFTAENLPGYMMLLPMKVTQNTINLRVFAGPLSTNILKAVDAAYTDPATGANPDYIGAQSYHGFFSFISEPFAKFLFILMNFFHSITGSWAFSIILLTVALRIMMYPLNAWSTKSMVAMQQIAPEITAIQEKNKKDPKKAQLEILDLYRQKGVNPLSGCFPLLIQLPFLIGMFDLLKTTFELRGACFIPGWIDDLTAPDVLFSWKTPLFFIGNQFHLLPVLLGGVMFLQQRLMTTGPSNVNEMTDQQRQQRAMATMMPVIFTLMFYNFPSGLNLYWLSSTLLGMAQQWWTQKRMAKSAIEQKTISNTNKRK